MNKMNIYAFADEAGAELSVQIAAMLRNRMQGLEIRNIGKTNVSDLKASEAKEIRRQLDDAGLRTWSIGSPIGKIDIVKDDFAAHMDKFRNTIEVAHILGAENIRLFSFYIPKGEDPAQYRNAVLDRLNQMVEAAAGSGVDLCHENEKGIYGDIASRCLDVLEHVKGLHGIFDPANFVQCGQDTLEGWAMLKDHIKYMHIKDALPTGKVVPAGKGNGHLPEILAAFAAQGGTALTLEPHLYDFSGLSKLERAGEKSVVGEYHFETPDAAFDAASNALKAILATL